jgi:hypothetical protein
MVARQHDFDLPLDAEEGIRVSVGGDHLDRVLLALGRGECAVDLAVGSLADQFFEE